MFLIDHLRFPGSIEKWSTHDSQSEAVFMLNLCYKVHIFARLRTFL